MMLIAQVTSLITFLIVNQFIELSLTFIAYLLLNYVILSLGTKHAIFHMTSMRSGVIDPKVDIPEIDVTFTNGVTKKLILRHYNAIPSSESADHSRFCNYLGQVEGDETNSVIAVTGCLMGDKPDKRCT